MVFAVRRTRFAAIRNRAQLQIVAVAFGPFVTPLRRRPS